MPVGLAAWGVAFVSILGGEIGRSGVVAEVNEIDLWVLSGCSALVVKDRADRRRSLVAREDLALGG